MLAGLTLAQRRGYLGAFGHSDRATWVADTKAGVTNSAPLRATPCVPDGPPPPGPEWALQRAKPWWRGVEDFRRAAGDQSFPRSCRDTSPPPGQRCGGQRRGHGRGIEIGFEVADVEQHAGLERVKRYGSPDVLRQEMAKRRQKGPQGGKHLDRRSGAACSAYDGCSSFSSSDSIAVAFSSMRFFSVSFSARRWNSSSAMLRAARIATRAMRSL
jgi:hypothetical protein